MKRSLLFCVLIMLFGCKQSNKLFNNTSTLENLLADFNFNSLTGWTSSAQYPAILELNEYVILELPPQESSALTTKFYGTNIITENTFTLEFTVKLSMTPNPVKLLNDSDPTLFPEYAMFEVYGIKNNVLFDVFFNRFHIYHTPEDSTDPGNYTVGDFTTPLSKSGVYTIRIVCDATDKSMEVYLNGSQIIAATPDLPVPAGFGADKEVGMILHNKSAYTVTASIGFLKVGSGLQIP